jgi:hypothetical protein
MLADNLLSARAPSTGVSTFSGRNGPDMTVAFHADDGSGTVRGPLERVNSACHGPARVALSPDAHGKICCGRNAQLSVRF